MDLKSDAITWHNIIQILFYWNIADSYNHTITVSCPSKLCWRPEHLEKAAVSREMSRSQCPGLSTHIFQQSESHSHLKHGLLCFVPSMLSINHPHPCYMIPVLKGNPAGYQWTGSSRVAAVVLVRNHMLRLRVLQLLLCTPLSCVWRCDVSERHCFSSRGRVASWAVIPSLFSSWYHLISSLIFAS